jgi:aminopeptidase
MDTQFLHAYARILLRVGVNLQQGQNIRIAGEPIHRDFMLILAEEAYRAGGRAVKLQYSDERHALIRAACLDARYLDYVPGYVVPELQSYLDEDWALLHVDGAEDPDMLAGADTSRLAAMQRAQSAVSQFFTLQVMANKLTWCVAPMPTRKWAEKVLGPTVATASRNYGRSSFPRCASTATTRSPRGAITPACSDKGPRRSTGWTSIAFTSWGRERTSPSA